MRGGLASLPPELGSSDETLFPEMKSGMSPVHVVMLSGGAEVLLVRMHMSCWMKTYITMLGECSVFVDW